MKRAYAAIVMFFIIAGSFVFADSVSISVNQLPDASKKFLNRYFPDIPVMSVRSDSGEYDVVLSNKTFITFMKNGNWEEVTSAAGVPTAFLPEAAVSVLNKEYPGIAIIQIDKDSNSYEVKLSNHMELTFSLQGKLLRSKLDT